jgi:hypothetical protein
MGNIGDMFMVGVLNSDIPIVGVLNAGVGILIGGNVTVPGLALSSDPGSKRSMSLGDCPEKLGRGEDVRLGSKTLFVSSNKLLRLLVT